MCGNVILSVVMFNIYAQGRVYKQGNIWEGMCANFFSQRMARPLLFWEWQLAHALLTTCACSGSEELGCVVYVRNVGAVPLVGRFVSGGLHCDGQ